MAHYKETGKVVTSNGTTTTTRTTYKRVTNPWITLGVVGSIIATVLLIMYCSSCGTSPSAVQPTASTSYTWLTNDEAQFCKVVDDQRKGTTEYGLGLCKTENNLCEQVISEGHTMSYCKDGQ